MEHAQSTATPARTLPDRPPNRDRSLPLSPRLALDLEDAFAPIGLSGVVMNSRPADVILSRLSKVRETGTDRWLARCPAHDDKTPSLSIRDLDDGRVLIFCHAGCAAPEIVDALALDLRDLFPDKRIEPRRWQHKGPPMRSREVIEIIQHELTVVSIGASVAAKNELPPDECARLSRASARIREAVSYATDR